MHKKNVHTNEIKTEQMREALDEARGPKKFNDNLRGPFKTDQHVGDVHFATRQSFPLNRTDAVKTPPPSCSSHILDSSVFMSLNSAVVQYP